MSERGWKFRSAMTCIIIKKPIGYSHCKTVTGCFWAYILHCFVQPWIHTYTQRFYQFSKFWFSCSFQYDFFENLHYIFIDEIWFRSLIRMRATASIWSLQKEPIYFGTVLYNQQCLTRFRFYHREDFMSAGSNKHQSI